MSMTTYKTMYDKVPLRDRPLVKSIKFKLEYTRSGNVKGTAWVHYKNGQGDYIGNLKAGGYGYDKMGHIMEEVLNTVARQNLLDYDFEKGKEYEGVHVSPNGEAYYTMIDSRSGNYFNFNIDETAFFKNGEIAQFDIKFKNAMLDKFYGHKTVPQSYKGYKTAVYGKNKPKNVLSELKDAYKRML